MPGKNHRRGRNSKFKFKSKSKSKFNSKSYGDSHRIEALEPRMLLSASVIDAVDDGSVIDETSAIVVGVDSVPESTFPGRNPYSIYPFTVEGIGSSLLKLTGPDGGWREIPGYTSVPRQAVYFSAIATPNYPRTKYVRQAVYQYDMLSGKSTVIADGEVLGASGDGRFILIGDHLQKNDLKVYDTLTGGEQIVVIDRYASFYGARISGNGRYVMFETYRLELSGVFDVPYDQEDAVSRGLGTLIYDRLHKSYQFVGKEVVDTHVGTDADFPPAEPDGQPVVIPLMDQPTDALFNYQKVDYQRQRLGIGLVTSGTRYTAFSVDRYASGLPGEFTKKDLFIYDAVEDRITLVSDPDYDLSLSMWGTGPNPTFFLDRSILVFTAGNQTYRYDLTNQTVIDHYDGALVDVSDDANVLLLIYLEGSEYQLVVVDTADQQWTPFASFSARYQKPRSSLSDNGRFVVFMPWFPENKASRGVSVYDRMTQQTLFVAIVDEQANASNIFEPHIANDGVHIQYRTGYRGSYDHTTPGSDVVLTVPTFYYDAYTVNRLSGEVTHLSGGDDANGNRRMIPLVFPAGSNDAEVIPIGIAPPVIEQPIVEQSPAPQAELVQEPQSPVHDGSESRNVSNSPPSIIDDVALYPDPDFPSIVNVGFPVGIPVSTPAIMRQLFTPRINFVIDLAVVTLHEVAIDSPLDRFSGLVPTDDDLLDRDVSLGLDASVGDVW